MEICSFCRSTKRIDLMPAELSDKQPYEIVNHITLPKGIERIGRSLIDLEHRYVRKLFGMKSEMV